MSLLLFTFLWILTLYYAIVIIFIILDLIEVSIYPFFETKKQVLFALFPFIYVTSIFKFVKNWWNELN